MIPGAHFYRQMADLTEQLFNPETIGEPGSLIPGEHSIKMTSHQAASLKSRSPGINPGRKIQVPRGFQAPGMPIRLATKKAHQEPGTQENIVSLHE